MGDDEETTIEASASSGTTVHEPPIAGRIVLKDVYQQFPPGLGSGEGSDELSLPLPRCSLRLYLSSANGHHQDLDVWSQTRDNGRFRFSGALLAKAARELERESVSVEELGIVIYAGNTSLRVTGRGPQDDERVPWRFRVGPHDSEGGYVQQALSHEMTIEVPVWADQASVLQPGQSLGPPVSVGSVSADGWRAFYACALLKGMRWWYFHAYLRHHRGEGLELPNVDVVFPSNGNCYDPERRLVYISSQGAPLPGGGRAKGFTASTATHEYGHALTFAIAPRVTRPIGVAHSFVAPSGGLRSIVLSDYDGDVKEHRLALGCQLVIDFWEAYATFIGQSFLGHVDYEQDAQVSFDLESPGYFGDRVPAQDGQAHQRLPGSHYETCVRGYGDWCTAAYLWDLTDRGHARRERDRVNVAFERVHEVFRSFVGSQSEASRYCVLPDFHDRLVEGGVDSAARLGELLDTNHLREAYERWRALSSAQRAQVHADIRDASGS